MKQNVRNNTFKVVLVLLARCIQSIGDIENVTVDLLKRLYAGDLTYALLKLRIISEGKDSTQNVTCMNLACRKPFSYDIDLETLEVDAPEEVEEEFPVKLKKGYFLQG